jgi:hypothetical protein
MNFKTFDNNLIKSLGGVLCFVHEPTHSSCHFVLNVTCQRAAMFHSMLD